MLGSIALGYLRNKLGVIWRLRSLWAKMSLLAMIFALVPVFLYAEFSKAYQDSQDLLMQSVRGQGRVISPVPAAIARECRWRQLAPS
jgi:hypothetical protein